MMHDGKRTRLPFTQNMIGGLVLMALGGTAAWLTSDLSQGNLAAMGAGFLPRWLAIGIVALGLALVGTSLRSNDEAFGHLKWRGVGLVMLAIFGFALMIRPFHLGAFTVPGLGLIIAGPFAVIVAGFAAPEARLREMIILALMLTAFCILLFGDILNLPLPVFPQFLASTLVGIPAKLLLRSAAAALIIISVALLVLKKRQQRHATRTEACHD
ncbi:MULTISPECIES: tripartite tricarboxylate transporter TctB family protein [Rhizobium/Agrobacterium group]|uniref:tripartite tricarboxylate transporter TctB family protein n=2 Tax=Rhizobium/Agrobacterium group TaxID=227290 RepID=UPI001F3AC9AD|nr:MULTISPECIES: tripartite tricarboxylate transporter TctB family protein [Rhizobium/Agrobacterium group]